MNIRQAMTMPKSKALFFNGLPSYHSLYVMPLEKLKPPGMPTLGSLVQDLLKQVYDFPDAYKHHAGHKGRKPGGCADHRAAGKRFESICKTQCEQGKPYNEKTTAM